MELDKRFLNVILLGFGFMFVFTAFQTMGNIQKTVLDSIHKEDSNFNGDGYTSLAVIYAVMAISNWLAPSIISVSGPKIAMLIGAVTYALFIAQFLIPLTWLLYVASVVIGFGAALIWTGQGNYLTLNSDSKTISRNSGIFWAMLQMSLFIGNIFVFFTFQGQTVIGSDTRLVLFIVLLAVCGLGTVFLVILRPARGADGQAAVEVKTSPLAALKSAFSLFFTKEMFLLSITFLYTGLELSFFSGVYSPSVGFTLNLGENAKQLVGLSGTFIGLGEVIGGGLFGILGKKMIRWGRDPIVMLGFVVHMLSFFLIFLNLPDKAPFGDTWDGAYISSNQYLAIFCSFLLGFGDSCYNTQIYSILGGVFSENSAAAFAVFKFIQSVAAAASFFYSSYMGLHVQLGILVCFCVVGSLTFCVVEWWSYVKKKNRGEIDTSCAEKTDAIN